MGASGPTFFNNISPTTRTSWFSPRAKLLSPDHCTRWLHQNRLTTPFKDRCGLHWFIVGIRQFGDKLCCSSFPSQHTVNSHSSSSEHWLLTDPLRDYLDDQVSRVQTEFRSPLKLSNISQYCRINWNVALMEWQKFRHGVTSHFHQLPEALNYSYNTRVKK